MAPSIPLNPPLSGAYLSEVVPFYTNHNSTLNLLMLWETPYGTQNVPLQVLQYNPSTNAFFDDTSAIFAGSIPSTDNPRNVTMADFNGDGNQDVIIANQGLDQSPWPGTTDTLLLSTANGQLINASANLPQTLAYTHDVSSGVIDRAGDIGVFFNNIYSAANTAPYYLIGNGGGTFTNDSTGLLPTSLHSTYPTFTSSALVDVNGDGLADLILGEEDQTVGPSLVYLNPGNGNFSNVTPIALPASPLPATTGLYSSTPAGPVILDIEPIHLSSPNYNDLVVISTTGNYQGYAIQILINDGTGHFTDQTASRLSGAPSEMLYPASSGQPWVVRSFIANLNSNGPDIVTQSNDGAPSQVFLNDGSGHFNLAMSTTSVSIMAVTSINGVPTLIESNGALVPYSSPPVVANQTSRQNWLHGQPISFALPSNTFSDPNGYALTYSAGGLNGTSLPSWLSFNASTKTFSGTVPAGAADFTATVTATDPNGWLTEDTFNIFTSVPPVKSDFNNDRTSDVLLQNGGTVVDWTMQNSLYSTGNVLTAEATGYATVGTGDFIGNGTADVLLQKGGTVVDWIMSNGQYQSGNVITTAATGFTVVGTGDFTGDGVSDVLLQNGGTVVDWIMSSGQYQSGNVITTAATGYTVVGTGDLTGNGTADVLLQNGGTVVDWLMQNGAYQSGNVLTTGATGWTVVGSGDFAGTGTDDVLLQNGGTVVDWIMKDGQYSSGNVLTTAATGFTVVGTGDYNGDGTSDVLLQNGGTVVDWIMKNGAYQSGNVVTTGATGFTVAHG
jgi:uncharacterized protein YukJ